MSTTFISALGSRVTTVVAVAAMGVALFAGSGAVHANEPPEPVHTGEPCERRGETYPEGTVIFDTMLNRSIICDSGHWHTYTPPVTVVQMPTGTEGITKADNTNKVPSVIPSASNGLPEKLVRH